jgi:hypothetical protein
MPPRPPTLKQIEEIRQDALEKQKEAAKELEALEKDVEEIEKLKASITALLKVPEAPKK